MTLRLVAEVRSQRAAIGGRLALALALIVGVGIGLAAGCGDSAGDDDDGDGECGVLLPGDSLGHDEEVESCDGRFRFIHQGDGNVVLYQGEEPLWATGTDGQDTDELEFREDGNLVLKASDGDILFSTDTDGSDLRFVMQDDGNAVIYDQDDEPLWSTGTYEGSGGDGDGDGGCTADVDCGSCERCERSSGNCVSRLSC